MHTLELLAPARDLACGIAAVDSGPDAVYIGSSHLGARAAAGNSIDDIRTLCDYAHKFGVKVHVTVNTIIYDDELEKTMSLIRELEKAGVDAFLVQDMGLLSRIREEGIAVSLHASTQCDSRTAEKVKWLSSKGFDRVVLARELSADEIAAIHKVVPDTELEVFVHGALCVSYSGVCYASQYCFGRSANRGECAQFCRLKFDLKDSDGRTIEHQRHLLSLKDMCQIDNIEALCKAGATAFKIEGRLKDASYVKNVVAAYSQRLNEIVENHPSEYVRESYGRVTYKFTPDLKKTFNRGYTTYFLNGRQPDIFSPDTPKALGEFVGHVKEIRHDSFNVAGTATFANGDGLCFINEEHELEGFRVNRAVGNRLYPFKMPHGLKAGMALYRNNDQSFEHAISGKSSERKIPVEMTFDTTDNGFSLTISSCLHNKRAQNSPNSVSATTEVKFAHQEAKKPQHDNIIHQLSKLGTTVFQAKEIKVSNGADTFFIPSSVLSDLRRMAVEKFDEAFTAAVNEKDNVITAKSSAGHEKVWQREYNDFPYLYNISNKAAVKFYEKEGIGTVRPALELKSATRPLIMQCRHCLRYSLGFCVRRGGKHPSWHEPLFLQLDNGRRFRLEFKCDECQMNIYAD